MAVKSNFAAGEILTASNVNTYLTNGGLVYITEATASGTATLNITGCFSSIYDNYRIIGTEMRSTSAATEIRFRYLDGTTANTDASYGVSFVGLSTIGASTNYSYASLTYGWISSCFSTAETGSAFSFDITAPYLLRRTVMLGNTENLNGGLNGFEFRSGGTVHDNTTRSFTGIQFYASAGNLSGKFKIYGYRQA